jgi:hypothetical protein
MKSHTVPRKLLDQFAYDDPVTKSRRLYRYEKTKAPRRDASPTTATRWDGHFADPANAAKEEQIELRLKREFEDPMNEFIETVGYRTFVFTPSRIRLLAGYMRMLFNRSLARRSASDGHIESQRQAMRSLFSNEERMSAIVAKQTMDLVELGIPAPRMVRREEIIEAGEKIIQAYDGSNGAQRRYIENIETMMSFPDENMLNGQWDIIRAEPDEPFVIGDAPVVTWARTDRNMLMWGLGFARPNVEAFLPISPTVCLHVLPHVPRTRRPLTPATTEVNMGQAAFATSYCFANLGSPKLDATLQAHFGKMRMGIDGFNTNHIDVEKRLFDILMNQCRAVTARQ